MIIHEIASKKIVPIVKGILAHQLSENGFTQRKIAYILGVTQPQVNKYLSKSIDYYRYKIEKIGINPDRFITLVRSIAETAIRGDKGKFLLMLNSVIDHLVRDYICRFFYDDFKTYCDTGRFSDPYIEEYRSFIKRLISLESLFKLIPEVGSNIVYAPGEASHPIDVIGLSGRLVKTGLAIGVIGEPMYGGSTHLSRVLLIARKYDVSKKVAMNIAYIPLPEPLEKTYRVAYTGPHSSIEDFWNSIEKALASKPSILLDKGGVGLEPITYVFTRDFSELEEILRYIIRRI
ncbi:MAG: thiamine-phosphate synthase family protein [Desulfurococcaceae archaeon]